MLYTQYKDAALKHLQASKTALRGLSFYKGATNSTLNLSKEALLFDIFYLSGYTLECIINYALYKKTGWTTQDVKEVYDISRNFAFFKKPNYNGTRNRVQVQNRSGNYVDFSPRYFIEQHRFNNNIGLLSSLLPNSQIPLIDSSVNISQKMKEMIFDSLNGRRNNNYWKAEMRYEPITWFSSRYNEQDVREFFALTETIYNELQKV